MELTNRIRVGRAELSISQQELANMVGVSRQAISLIERGKSAPSIQLAYKIAMALKMDITDVFRGVK